MVQRFLGFPRDSHADLFVHDFPCNLGALGRTRTSDARFRNEFSTVLPETSGDVWPVQVVFPVCPVTSDPWAPRDLIPKGFPKWRGRMIWPADDDLPHQKGTSTSGESAARDDPGPRGQSVPDRRNRDCSDLLGQLIDRGASVKHNTGCEPNPQPFTDPHEMSSIFRARRGGRLHLACVYPLTSYFRKKVNLVASLALANVIQNRSTLCDLSFRAELRSDKSVDEAT